MARARILVLHPALGPLDYRVPPHMSVQPGSIVVVPIGPRQYAGVVWEAERLPVEEIGDNRLTVMAGIAALDELYEAQSQISKLKANVEELTRAGEAMATETEATEQKFTRQLAERTVLVVFNLGDAPVGIDLPGELARLRPLEGHGLLSGKLEGSRLQLPGYGAWFAGVA